MSGYLRDSRSHCKGTIYKRYNRLGAKKGLSGRFRLKYFVDYKSLKEIEDKLGFRIIMTNRHSWSTASIIEAYHGQSKIESAFKNLKNPSYCKAAVSLERPQY